MMMHNVSPGQPHCSGCNDAAYTPAPMNALFDGTSEFAAGAMTDFNGFPATQSAHRALEAIQRQGGHRWTRTSALLATLTDLPSDARAHRVHASPIIWETYVKRIGGESGVRIYWTAAPATTLVAVEHYPHPEASA